MPVITAFISSFSALVLHSSSPLEAAVVGASTVQEQRPLPQEDVFALIQQIDRQRRLLLRSLLELGTTRAAMLHATLPETFRALAQVQGIALTRLAAGHLPPLEEIMDLLDTPRTAAVPESAAALGALALYGDVRIRTTDLAWLLGRSSGRMLLGEHLSEPLRRQLRGEWNALPDTERWTLAEREVLLRLSDRIVAMRGSAEKIHAALWRSRREHASLLERLRQTLRSETDFAVLQTVTGLQDDLSPTLQIVAAVRACQRLYASVTAPLLDALDVEPLPPCPAHTAAVLAAA